MRLSRSSRTFSVFVTVMVASLSLFTGGTARGAAIFALVAEENGNLDRLNITTGTSELIANNGKAFEGLAYNGDQTVLYGMVSNAFFDPTSLVTINQTTGASTPVGPNNAALLVMTGLGDGRLFGVDGKNDLYSINPSTGAATRVGATGLAALSGFFGNSLASDGTSLYYTLSLNGGNSQLYTLNPSTGAATPIGSTGVPNIFGSAFAGETFATGQLYGFTSSGQTVVINRTTGAATPLNSNGISDIFGGVGLINQVPEPAAMAPLVFLGASRLRRRRALRR